MGLFRRLSQRRRSSAREHDAPPSPPPPLPSRSGIDPLPQQQQAPEDIPIVFGEEIPGETPSVGPVATACEVLVPSNDMDAGSHAGSFAVSTAQNTWQQQPPGTAYSSHPHRPSSGIARGYSTANSSTVGNTMNNTGSSYVTSPAPYSSAPEPSLLPSSIHVPQNYNHHHSSDASAMSISTSPMSVRSTYTSAAHSHIPGPPAHHYSSPSSSHRRSSAEVLREAAETAPTMTTGTGVQLQQLSMVNMQGRRMTPYVTKRSNNNTNGSCSRTTRTTRPSDSTTTR